MSQLLVRLCFSLSLFGLASAQPTLLTGRFDTALGNTNKTSLPLILSWPMSQATVSFKNSATVTALLVDSNYAGLFPFTNFDQYVSFTAAGAVTSAVAFDGANARIQLSGLSGAEQTATLTKIDESSEGQDSEEPGVINTFIMS